MKRRHLLFLAMTLIISHFSYSQGWLGSGQNLYTVPSPSFTSVNVGIGTTSPSAQFHTTGTIRHQNLTNLDSLSRVLVSDINGNIFYRNASTLGTANAWLLTGNAGTSPTTNFIGTTDNNAFAIRTNNAERIRVTTAGTVGINITTPGAPLHVFANATDSQLFVSGIAPSIRLFNGPSWNAVQYTQTARFGLANQTNDYVVNSVKGDFIVQTVDTVGSLIFGVGLIPGLLNGMERMRIAKTGFVGINNASPSARLDVNCALNTGQGNSNIRFENLNTSTGKALVIDANGYVYQSSTSLAVASSDEIQRLQSDLNDARNELANMKARLGLIESTMSANRLSSFSTPLTDLPRLLDNRPNPTSGQTTIDYYLPSNVGQANCVITTLDGRTVASYPLTPQKGNGNVNVLLNNTGAGLYLYTLTVDGKVIDTQKLMLSK